MSSSKLAFHAAQLQQSRACLAGVLQALCLIHSTSKDAAGKAGLVEVGASSFLSVTTFRTLT